MECGTIYVENIECGTIYMTKNIECRTIYVGVNYGMWDHIWVGFPRTGIYPDICHFFENFEGLLWPYLIS